MKPTLPLQLHGEIMGLPPAASSVSSPQHSLHLGAPVLDTEAADALLCMLPAAAKVWHVPRSPGVLLLLVLLLNCQR
jgi:hypothetical protein